MQTMSLSTRQPSKPRQSESTAPSVYTTQGTFASRPYAPSTAYAPSVVSTVQATNGHAGASTVNLPAETASVGVSDRPASPPRTPAYPTHEPEPAVGAIASSSAPGLGLPPALGSGPVGKKGGLMARIGTARKVSGDKIVKFFNNTHKDEPATASSTSGGISAFLRDTQPGMPPLGPVSGAATSAATPPPPPPPKKKGDDSASVVARSAPATPSLEAAAEFDSAGANAYDGLASPTEEGFPASTNGHEDAVAEKETLSTSQQVSGVLSVPWFYYSCLADARYSPPFPQRRHHARSVRSRMSRPSLLESPTSSDCTNSEIEASPTTRLDCAVIPFSGLFLSLPVKTSLA